MTRPIRNTGLYFPSGLPRQRGQRHVFSHTEFYTPIFCMLSVFQAIPFKLPRKPTTVNRWNSTLGTPRGDKYYNQYCPLCEVCPRDHGKVVESLQGQWTHGWHQNDTTERRYKKYFFLHSQNPGAQHDKADQKHRATPRTLQAYAAAKFVLFDVILYVPSTIFQFNRDGSSWVEQVLS